MSTELALSMSSSKHWSIWNSLKYPNKYIYISKMSQSILKSQSYIYLIHYILELPIGVNNNMLEDAEKDRILHKVTSDMYVPVAE